MDNSWPLAWLVFVCLFFLSPIDIFRRSSRYWLLRVLFRVCTPGYSRVEVCQLYSLLSNEPPADAGQFIAFFLADEMNRWVGEYETIIFQRIADLVAKVSCGPSRTSISWRVHVRFIRFHPRSSSSSSSPVSDTKHWPADTFQQCPVGQRWPYGVILGFAPLARLIQCLKRYHDSGIGIHLVNVSLHPMLLARTELTR